MGLEAVKGEQQGFVTGWNSMSSMRGVYAQTAENSATPNFPVYDAWDGEICPRPAFMWFGFPSELSDFRPNYGKFERETSEN